MKKGICLALLLAGVVSTAFAYNFNTDLPLPGKSIASAQVQRDSLFTVYSYGLRIAAPDCQTLSITDTNVTKPMQNGSWGETWTIKACSRTAKVPITFTNTEAGTTYAIDYMNVKVAK
jgi:hypothetical protein